MAHGEILKHSLHATDLKLWPVNMAFDDSLMYSANACEYTLFSFFCRDSCIQHFGDLFDPVQNDETTVATFSRHRVIAFL